jgi:hypothetical protein
MPPVPPAPPVHVAGPDPENVLPSMHVFGMAAALIVTVTVASAGVRLETVKLKPPAGSMYVWPWVMPFKGLVDGFMSIWTLRAQVRLGIAMSSEATTITDGVIPVSSPVPFLYSR